MADHRLLGSQAPTFQRLRHHAVRKERNAAEMRRDFAVDCSWGHIIMGHTFEQPEAIAQLLCQESPGKRDIALYVDEPHVVLSYAPQRLFLDPSDTLRLNLATYRASPESHGGVTIRRIQSKAEAVAVNDIYAKRQMVTADPEFLWENRSSKKMIYLVAEEVRTGKILGTVMGVNHIKLFNDPSGGSSLWCLAVDPQSQIPGIGVLLVRYLAEYFTARNCVYLDLSVMHDNYGAKALYENLGFQKVRTFSIKNKNAFNENLFVGPEIEDGLNPYASIIVNEARFRGIHVEVLDAEEGFFRLSHGGTQIVCRESLSELTSAIAMSRCQDKAVTYRCLRPIGVRTPHYIVADREKDNSAFLVKHKKIVVKPSTGEQGKGITIGVSDEKELDRAIALANRYGDRVMLESFHSGKDLRIVVIDYKVVAAAIRRPAEIVGDGQHNVLELIEKQSRRRAAATSGESTIPVDAQTLDVVQQSGYEMSAILPLGTKLVVRKTANLHTGGTIHDVTDELHRELVVIAEKIALQLVIPVVGLDFLVPDHKRSDYTFIEANERVGLANHEPRPTAQRFIDLLFPLTTTLHYNSE